MAIRENIGLTQDLIKRLTSYYGLALRSNTDVEDMKKAVMATFHNVSSTDAEPHQELCPSGARSWCRHRAAEAEGKPQLPHTYNLPNKVVEALRPVYQRLSDPQLQALDGSNDSGSQMYPIVAAYYIEESRNMESRLLCLQELHREATGREIGNLVLDALKSRAEDFETRANAVAIAGKVSDQIAGAVAALGQILFEGAKKRAAPKLSGSYQIPKAAAALADVRDEVQRDHQKQKEPRGKMDATPAKKVKPSSESTGRASLTCEERAPQIHLLQSLLVQFLRDLLARFVNPSAIKACSLPLEVPYQDLKNQKANEDLFLGSRTLSVVEGLRAIEKHAGFTTKHLPTASTPLSDESSILPALSPSASPRYFHASASTENYSLILGGCNGSREAILEPFAYGLFQPLDST
ncbi:hypothetical protein HPB52_005608 [Rhipicephalus sanguineus]|uniref:Uncharacterized protein n=1 Tax=Rhipicephalus sanguineus TaxID=34632 RepID=A0A9D4SRI1_RHISA|nr:hypothetical protein HPB52_005608 [Rhipicephalus sanguineus]